MASLYSISKSTEEKALLVLCEKNLTALGFRVVDVDFSRGSQSRIRFFVEKSTGQAVTIDECAEISRLLGPLLDNESWMTGPYELEVSSAGLDRRLREVADFERVVGEKIKVHLTEPVEGRSQLAGQLGGVREGTVVIESDGKSFTYPLEKIKKAHKVWQADKVGHERK